MTREPSGDGRPAGRSTSGSWWRWPARSATGRSCSTASRARARRWRCTSPGGPTRGTCLLVEGATYAVNPDPVFIPPTSNDLALHRDAVYRMRFEEFFDAACARRRRPDVPVRRPDRRLRQHERHRDRRAGPGRAAEDQARRRRAAAATSPRRSARSPCGPPGTGPGRTLVPELDFLTDIGHRTPEGTARRAGLHRRRPAVADHRARACSTTTRTGTPGCARSGPDVDGRRRRGGDRLRAARRPRAGHAAPAERRRAGRGARRRPARCAAAGVRPRRAEAALLAHHDGACAC